MTTLNLGTHLMADSRGDGKL